MKAADVMVINVTEEIGLARFHTSTSALQRFISFAMMLSTARRP